MRSHTFEKYDTIKLLQIFSKNCLFIMQTECEYINKDMSRTNNYFLFNFYNSTLKFLKKFQLH
jgi:hypothetical protein